MGPISSSGTPAVVRGIEVYKGKLIIYCAGNFLDDYVVDPVERNDQSFLFVIELNETMLSHLFLYPTVIHHLQARRASNEECEVIREGMQRRCENLETGTRWNEQENRLEVDIGPMYGTAVSSHQQQQSRPGTPFCFETRIL
jgi:poly-gamma-glutamate synthesis protein (capsule biosynthesis protein)